MYSSDSPYNYVGYQHKAKALIDEGRWANALVLLKASEAIKPDSDITEDLLGKCYFGQGKFVEALDHFKKAYEVCRIQDTKHLIKAGMTLMQLGRYPEAAQTFEKVQKDYPKDASIYNHLLVAYEFADNPREAMAWADRGLKNLSDAPWDYVLLTMVSARLAYRQEQDEVVESKLDEVLAKFPEAFWYSDLSRLLKGETTLEEFKTLLETKYRGPEFESSADLYLLMSLVLNKKWGDLKTFLKTNESKLETIVKEQTLFKKELARAKEALNAHEL